MDHPKDKLVLTDMDWNKGPYLCLWSENADRVEDFKRTCYLYLPKTLNWFHQCDAAEYQMFEFWKPETQGMRTAAQDIANRLGLEWEDRLEKDYPLR